jgi:hypothetical protein
MNQLGFRSENSVIGICVEDPHESTNNSPRTNTKDEPRTIQLAERIRKRKYATPTGISNHGPPFVGHDMIACESVAVPRLNEAKMGVNLFNAANANNRLSRC